MKPKCGRRRTMNQRITKLCIIPLMLILLFQGVLAYDVQDTLQEGESQTYTLDDLDYEATLVYVSDPGEDVRVKLSINGQLLDPLLEGETQNYNISGNNYEVTVVYLTEENDDFVAKMSINGVLTQSLSAGETHTITIDKVDLEITNVYVYEEDESEPTAKFSINGELTGFLEEGEWYTHSAYFLKVIEIDDDQREGVVEFILGNNEAYPVPTPVPDDGYESNYHIVIGDTAPSTDVLDAIDLVRVISAKNVDESVYAGIAILDNDAYELAIKDSDFLEDNVVIVLNEGYALISVGDDDELQPIERIARQHLQDRDFAHKTKYYEEMTPKYLIVENMRSLFEGSTEEDNDVACAQVVTPAWEPNTNRCIEFSTPCDVPQGWIKVASCEGNDEVDDDDVIVPEDDFVCQSGCIKNDRCVPIGTRIANGHAEFCTIDNTFEEQLVDGMSCQNSYECVSNQCLNAVCTSLEKEVRETQGLLQKIWGAISSWFN